MTKNISKNEEIKRTAVDFAKKQREISISEFFTKNRHLLGFDNPKKALLICVKEAVDNSLDACEEFRALPDIRIKIKQLGPTRYYLTVEDNGPGIVKKQIPNVFGKLLYGSKFHKLSQSRGQQGIGISAAALYSQLTTGKPIKITSKIGANQPAHYYEIHINTQKNEPTILKEEEVKWDVNNGTKVELELEAQYQKGARSVDDYLEQTAIANPHANIVYINPEGKRREFVRATKTLPPILKEIKPHPYGVELGYLINMLNTTKARTLQSFFVTEFCRVSGLTVRNICNLVNIKPSIRPIEVTREMAEKLYEAIQKTKIIAPPTDCISPIGEKDLANGLKKELKADFYTSVTRPPSVYRGNPFIVEAAIAFGGELPKEEQILIYRLANRVPLQYQQSACAITKSIASTNWKAYDLQQSGSNLPVGPVILVVHIASVWVPFTSESKEAIASYPEIVKEIKLALQECGRQLSIYLRKANKAKYQKEREGLFNGYIPEVADGLAKLSGENRDKIEKSLFRILKTQLPLINKENE